VGALAAVTAQEEARVVDAAGAGHRDVVEPRTAYGVARVARELRGGLTQIGLFGTAVERSLPARLDWLHSSAYAGGLNWSHRFAGNTHQFSGRLVGSLVRGSAGAIALAQRSSARYYQRPDADYVELDPTRTSLAGVAAGLNAGRTAGDWRWNVGLDLRSPGFEVNDVGFMREADRIQAGIWVNRRWLAPGKVFRRFNLNFNQWNGWTFGGDRRFTGGNVNGNFTLLNYWSGWFGINRSWGGLSTTALRGGPGLRVPGNWNAWYGMEADARKAVAGAGGGWIRREDETGAWAFGNWSNIRFRPAANVDLSVSPGLEVNHNDWQYLGTHDVAGSPQYLFGDLRQTTTQLTLRSNVTFSPALSLQVYAQPFVSSGRYEAFQRVIRPQADGFLGQFDRFGPDRAARDQDGNVSVDADGDGQQDVLLANPDFTVLSFRSNVVLRWEYKLGSTIFFVWQHGRSGGDGDGRFRFPERLGDIFRSEGENVLLVKVNYWLSL
jgi:hypothetical protein